MNEFEGIDLNEEIKSCKTIEDLTGRNGLFRKLMKQMIEGMLEQEMEDHLGYIKHRPQEKKSGNSRNGKSRKMVKSSMGELELEVPRDRKPSFSPEVVKKRQTDITDFDKSRDFGGA